MIRTTYKCPSCGKKPWIRPTGDGRFIMGCCLMYTSFPTEKETRSAWNTRARAKWEKQHT